MKYRSHGNSAEPEKSSVISNQAVGRLPTMTAPIGCLLRIVSRSSLGVPPSTVKTCAR